MINTYGNRISNMLEYERKREFLQAGGKRMPINEKELNAALFDQLTLVERIERQVQKGNLEAVKEEIEILKKEINRKLYQQPPLKSE